MAAKSILNVFLLSLAISGVCSDIFFRFENNCRDTLWLAASPSDGDLNAGNNPGTLESLLMPDPYNGVLWARTRCTTNATNYFSCDTGDCGTGEPICQGPPPAYPVTLLYIGINKNVVSYEVSLTHGHNVAVRIQPDGGSLVEGGSGPCPVVDCVQNIGNICPSPLVAKNKEGQYVGCNSACDVLRQCRGSDYNNQRVKQLCRLAHVYPTDFDPPIYKCSGPKSINITFCPT
ncbi:hypothetical protein K2173_002091 [Erythroxylum novogranatense]|uniref:Thaumatin-like protein n=1 Tax=Erythroxylum novogranatense TaxID=1862640 RepID=A0AAV8SPH9_9ROSI|nr:hypothetical protein K2173_002091 [Erythroxylum novogranatense]